MAKAHAVGHILFVEGADPERDRVVLDIGPIRTIIVAVPHPRLAPAVASDLVEEDGVTLIEVDGGLGQVWAARVIEAVGDAVPIGAVMFGAESLASAAAFAERYGSEAK
jgi:hypothetical protein